MFNLESLVPMHPKVVCVFCCKQRLKQSEQDPAVRNCSCCQPPTAAVPELTGRNDQQINKRRGGKRKEHILVFTDRYYSWWSFGEVLNLFVWSWWILDCLSVAAVEKYRCSWNCSVRCLCDWDQRCTWLFDYGVCFYLVFWLITSLIFSPKNEASVTAPSWQSRPVTPLLEKPPSILMTVECFNAALQLVGSNFLWQDLF